MMHAGTYDDPHVLGSDGRCADCGYQANRQVSAWLAGVHRDLRTFDPPPMPTAPRPVRRRAESARTPLDSQRR